MTQKTTDQGVSKMKVAVIGASIAALAAGAYFFLGPKGKKHRTQTKAWAIKMKGDVVEKLERAREVSGPIYHEIVDSVAARYTKEKRAGREEIRTLAQDLKKHWKTIGARAQAVKRDVVKGAKKAATKARR